MSASLGCPIIQVAETAFPGAAECAERILRNGRFCFHGSTLYDFLERFDDPWWSLVKHEGVIDDDATLASPSFIAGFREWIVQRRAWAIDRLTENLESANGLNLLRSIVVSNDWLPNQRLGVFWALNCGCEVSPYNGDESSGVAILVEGSVSADAVDWAETLFARMDYLNGDDEGEIQLRPGASVIVTKFDAIGLTTIPTPGRYLA